MRHGGHGHKPNVHFFRYEKDTWRGECRIFSEARRVLYSKSVRESMEISVTNMDTENWSHGILKLRIGWINEVTFIWLTKCTKLFHNDKINNKKKNEQTKAVYFSEIVSFSVWKADSSSVAWLFLAWCGSPFQSHMPLQNWYVRMLKTKVSASEEKSINSGW